MANSPSAALPSPVRPAPEGGIVRQLIRDWRHTPITVLVLYTLASVLIRENFPFSNFPMYSNPSAERMYYTLSGPDGVGLPVQSLTGITSPKIGKIYRKKADTLSKKLGRRPSDFTPAEIEQVGREIIAFLRSEAANLGKSKELPPKLQINRTWISYEEGRIVERPSVIAREAETGSIP